ncbi:MAG: CAP domain-containing protein, partial [Candidatus Binatia bacterium]
GDSGGAPLYFSRALRGAAQAALPDRGLEDFELASRQDALNALLRPERRHWQSFSLLSASCGGCGDVPTAADVRYFAQQWLDDPADKRDVLDPRVTHVGFAIASNGDGMKVALLVLGLGR